MDYIDKYRQRVAKNGNDIGEAYNNNTVNFIEATFKKAPTYRLMKVHSTQFPHITEIDARVVEVERLGSLREVIFRPNQYLDIGTYLEFDGDYWLIYDRYTAGIKTKVLVSRCNYVLKWKDKNSNIQQIKCIASSMELGSKAKQDNLGIEWNKYDVRLPLGNLFVFVEKNPLTKTIQMNQRFIFGSNVYEVIGIDDVTNTIQNGQYGIIKFFVKITTKHPEDDFENGIAYNSFVESDEEDSGSSNDTDIGGIIW